MASKKKKVLDPGRRRATVLPDDLGAWVDGELEKRGGMSFSLYCRLVLNVVKARSEQGDHLVPEPK